jgi:hypothetical protein
MEQATAKELKEAFVAGTSGTSLHEINALIALVPLATLVFRYLFQQREFFGLNVADAWLGGTVRSQEPAAMAAALLLEFYFILLPVICAMMGVVAPVQLFRWAAVAAAVPCMAALLRLTIRGAARQHGLATGRLLSGPRPQ